MTLIHENTSSTSLVARVRSVRRVSPKRFRRAWTYQLIILYVAAIWAVKNDTFRTLATDLDFKGRVKEDMLVRLLEAFVWRAKDRWQHQQQLSAGRSGNVKGKEPETPLSYVQGESIDALRLFPCTFTADARCSIAALSIQA